MSNRRILVVEDLILWLIGCGVSIALFFVSDVEPYVSLICIVCLGTFLLEKCILGDSLRLSNLTIPAFFIMVYIAVMALPSIITFGEMDHPIRYQYLLAIQSVLVTFPIGVGLANCIAKAPSRAIKGYAVSPVIIVDADRRFFWIVSLFLIGSVLIVGSYIVHAEYVQLIEVIKQYPTDIDPVKLRFAGSDDVPRGIQYSFELVRRFVLPLCAMYAYFMYQGNKSWKWKYAFFFVTSYGLFVSALTLDRAPPVAFVTMLILANFVSIKRGALTTGFFVKVGALIFAAAALGGAVSTIQYQSDFTLDMFIANIVHVVFYRILQDAPYMASIAFESFNDVSTFLYGRYMRILSVFPGFVYVESSESTVYSPAAPVGFVADLWRNWGWIGVIIGTLIIGFAYQVIQLKLFVIKTALTSTVNVILLVGAVWIIHGHVLGVMSTSILAFGVVFGLHFKSSARRWGLGHARGHNIAADCRDTPSSA